LAARAGVRPVRHEARDVPPAHPTRYGRTTLCRSSDGGGTAVWVSMS